MEKYIVIAGFLGGRLDETTGAGLTPHARGDVIELGANEAAVELHRNRVVAFDEATAASVLASVSSEAAS